MMSEEEQPLLGSQGNSQSLSNYVRGNKISVGNGGAVCLVSGSPLDTSAQRSAFYRYVYAIIHYLTSSIKKSVNLKVHF